MITMAKVFYAVAAQCPEKGKEDNFVIVTDPDFGIPLTTSDKDEAVKLWENQEDRAHLTVIKCEVIAGKVR